MECIKKTVIDLAFAEIGYLEKKTMDDLDSKTDNAGSANYTKYARDLDLIPGFYNGKKNGYPWCDVFVDWCFVQAYGIEDAKKLLCQPSNSLGAGCTYSADYYKKQNRFFKNDPQVGDQIFFGNAKECYHTGLVVAVEPGKVVTIEGNTSSSSGVIANGGGVFKKTYSQKYSEIYGYGRPNYYEPVAEVPEEPKQEEQKQDPAKEPEQRTEVETIEDETIKPTNTASSNIHEVHSTESQNIDGMIDTVREVQIWLNQSFSSGLSLDGLYGSPTKTALINALQKTVGVPVTGSYNTTTNNACKKLDLMYGKKGMAVKILQAFLVCHGYAEAYVDGDFGKGTKLAVIDYQRRKNLVADGIAAQATFKALCS